MGNRFATPGLSDEATHGTRDDRIRRTESRWRPSEAELANERIVTNTPKSEVLYTIIKLSWAASWMRTVLAFLPDVVYL